MHIKDLIPVAKKRGNGGFWYLATPYTKYPAGHEMAFRDASFVAGLLLSSGVPVFCPIAHTHPIAQYGNIHPTNANDPFFWLRLDRHMMDAACGIIVAGLDGWSESYGVNYEIGVFHMADKPLLLLDIDAEMSLPSRGEEARRADDRSSDWCEINGGGVVTPDQIAEMRCRHPETMSSAERKNYPLARGVLDYFPDALMEVAAISKAGNDKHNPGQPMHHARGKSNDHADCIMRHLKDRGTIDPEDGRRHSGKVAWRALALLQEELEAAGAPLARGARLAEYDAADIDGLHQAKEDRAAQAHVEGGAPRDLCWPLDAG